uniref:RNA helicase n=1 Tax=Petromyzon marinus TaxID=7757 RepID=A0AAJ7UHD8_PETMA|nr:putative ATP-dependent RNA helicase TDRD12 [Petromyzon marinus]
MCDVRPLLLVLCAGWRCCLGVHHQLSSLLAELSGLRSALLCSANSCPDAALLSLLVLCARWTPALLPLAHALSTDRCVLLRGGIEAAVYGGVRHIVHVCRAGQVIFTLLTLLGPDSEQRRKIVVFVKSETHVEQLHAMLMQGGCLSLGCTVPNPEVVDAVRRKWDMHGDLQHPRVLVTTDACARLLDVDDATCIVHYHFPESPAVLGARLCCLRRSFGHPLQPEAPRGGDVTARSPVPPAAATGPSSVTLAVKGAGVRAALPLLALLERTGSPVPAEMRRAAGRERARRERRRASRPLCPSLARVGACGQERLCQWRHILYGGRHFTRSATLPAGTRVTLLVTHVECVTQFSGRILRYRRPSETTTTTTATTTNNTSTTTTTGGEGDGDGDGPYVTTSTVHLRLAAQLSQHYARVAPGAAPPLPVPGQLYGVRLAAGFYCRARLLGVPEGSAPALLSVDLVDEGRSVTVGPGELLALPPALAARPPPLSVSVVLCGVRPAAGDCEWTPQALTFVRDAVQGTVVEGSVALAAEDTLWVDSLHRRTWLPGLRAEAVEPSVHAQLTSRGFAQANPGHAAALLRALASGAGAEGPGTPRRRGRQRGHTHQQHHHYVCYHPRHHCHHHHHTHQQHHYSVCYHHRHRCHQHHHHHHQCQDCASHDWRCPHVTCQCSASHVSGTTIAAHQLSTNTVSIRPSATITAHQSATTTTVTAHQLSTTITAHLSITTTTITTHQSTTNTVRIHPSATITAHQLSTTITAHQLSTTITAHQLSTTITAHPSITTSPSRDWSSSRSRDQSTSQSCDQSSSQSRDQSTCQSRDRFSSRSRDQSSQSRDQSTSQSRDRSSSQSRDQSTCQSRDQSTSQSRDQSTSQSRDQSTSQSRDQFSSQSRDQSTSQSRDKSSSQSRDKSSSQSRDQSTGQSRDQSTGQSRDQSTSLSRDQSSSQSRDQSSSQSRDQSSSQSRDQSSSQSRDQSSSQSRDQSTSQSRDQSSSQSRDQSTSQSRDQSTSQSRDKSSSQSRDQSTSPQRDQSSTPPHDWSLPAQPPPGPRFPWEGTTPASCDAHGELLQGGLCQGGFLLQGGLLQGGRLRQHHPIWSGRPRRRAGTQRWTSPHSVRVCAVHVPRVSAPSSRDGPGRLGLGLGCQRTGGLGQLGRHIETHAETRTQRHT